jgi:hypothetical protein
VVGGVGIQTRPYHDFLSLPYNLLSRVGMNNGSTVKIMNWPSPFIDHLPEYDATWIEEPLDFEMPVLTALTT